MKYGVIDVGGGLRGIYGAGVLDRCLEEDLRFDLCIGVSAGSANMASYLAGQHGRNKPFYDEYSFRREYMSVHNLIRKHSYLDLSYVYGTLSNAGGENPLDYAALARSPAELCVVAANAQNGEAQYFTKADLHPDDYRILMASCCIPVIDQPCVIDGVPYFDGGLADPVPLEWAFAHGCDRVALILTKPIGLVRSDAGTSIWHTCCSRITPLQPRGCAAGHGGTTRLSNGRGSWSDRALSASSPRTAPRECPP